ncbi:hypothetical protein E4T56_gene3749 [Termitomyces sp. T112]|nr:hypothetical protein E4T56_gene3749 [Termitomyces sp. T112]
MEVCSNGYVIRGDTTIFNPWSIVLSISKKKLDCWWVNSGSSDILHEILCPNRVEFADMLRIMGSNSPATRWSFLIHTGYLTVGTIQRLDGKFAVANIRIPNYEILTEWSKWLKRPFRKNRALDGPDMLMERLHRGERERFSAPLRNYLQDLSCFHITKGREDLYHVWMMGISVELKRRSWTVRSNYESDRGRLDISLELGDEIKAIVLKFIHLRAGAQPTAISAKVEEGFRQIAESNYCLKLGNHIKRAEIVSICLHDRNSEFKFGTAIREDGWKYDI